MVNIFVVASTLRPRPLLASVIHIPVANAHAWDPGIEIFVVNIFVDCDRSPKSAKILTHKNFQLYGTDAMWSSILSAVDSFPGGKLSLRALEHLQHTAKINLFRSIGAEWQHFAELPEVGLNIETQLQLPTSSEEYGRVVVKSWLENHGSTATWRSLLQLLESSKQLQIVASMIEQFFSAYSNMAALEERVYHLEQSQEEVLRREKVTLQIQEEVLQREKEATQKQVMTTNEIEELKSRLEIVEPLLQDLKEMEGRGKGGCIIMCVSWCDPQICNNSHHLALPLYAIPTSFWLQRERI